VVGGGLSHSEGPEVVEYRLHRLACPCCGTATWAKLPAGVPRASWRDGAGNRSRHRCLKETSATLGPLGQAVNGYRLSIPMVAAVLQVRSFPIRH
jgi:hypothetical protein